MKNFKKTAAALIAAVIGLSVSTVNAIAAESGETDIVRGDVNSDGVFSVADAVNFQMYISRKITLDESQLRCADMNGDDNVNVFDLVIMKRKLVEELSAPAVSDTPEVERPLLTLGTYDEYESYISVNSLEDEIVVYDDISQIGAFRNFIVLTEYRLNDYSEVLYGLDDDSGYPISLYVKKQSGDTENPDDSLILPSEINLSDMRTAESDDVSGDFIYDGKTYKYVNGKLLYVKWADDSFEYKLSGNSTLYDYPADADTFTSGLLFIDVDDSSEPDYEFNKSVYSIEEFNELKSSTELSDIKFADTVSSLPVPVIEDSEITWINYCRGYSQDTGEPYSIAYITFELSGGEWLRLEYMLDAENAKSAIYEAITADGFDGKIYSTSVENEDETIVVYAESRKELSSENETLISLYTDLNGVYARVVYKCNNAESVDISGIVNVLTLACVGDMS